uniref:Coiled-coil domain-containing protein 177 n=1 Tax=Cacopsylla melanoneura TaxID=428564 RepID=A0A8D8T181_9HEMI
MKSSVERSHHGLLINLDNFESQEAINSPYVLTSPRSLKACKKAGVKPVELLYRTCHEIATELGISVNHVRNIHTQQETERQRKLELCRRVRDELKTKQSRFHFFQRKSQTNKYINKGNNAKHKPLNKNLVTDSDDSRWNSPQQHYPTTPDIQRYSTTPDVPTLTSDESRKQVEPSKDRIFSEFRNRAKTHEVFHPRPPSTIPCASSPDSFQARSSFGRFAERNQNAPIFPRKNSDPGLPANATERNDVKMCSKTMPPRSLHFAGK